MALIKCIECNHEVSEFAENCPNCGCPVSMSKNTIKQNLNAGKFSVILTACGESKVKIAVRVKEITGLDVLSAKNIVDNLSTIKVNCSMDEANYIKKLIENEGASVDIVPYTPSHETIIETKNIPKCPKCGSTEFVPLRKKFSLLTGFATNKVDMVCKNCGTVRK